MGRPARVFGVVAFNLAAFALIFLVAEWIFRARRSGPLPALRSMVEAADHVPYSSIGTSEWVIGDEELGYRLNPAMEDTNNRSVRHSEIVVPKPEGSRRVLFLGDSLIWDEDGLVERIRQSWEGESIEVINAGVPGYTAYQQVGLYRRFLADTDPDLVVWTYCLNDNYRFLHRFDRRARMLITRQAKLALEIETPIDALIARSHLLTAFRLRELERAERRRESEHDFPWEGDRGWGIAWNDPSWSLYEEQLVELRSLLAPRGIPLVIVIFPVEAQVVRRGDEENREEILKPQRKLSSLCERYDVRCLDLFPGFSRLYDSGATLFESDGLHLNTAGHEAAAAEIESFLAPAELEPGS